MHERALFGRRAEDAAAQLLTAKGYAVASRNYRCEAGEMDLVAIRGRTVVFCEVKARRSALWGDPSEAVTPAKQARLRRIAAAWLREHSPRSEEIRFDVVAALDADGDLTLRHLENAF